MPVKRRCPNCGHPNTADTINCAQCGVPLTLTCPKCGTVRPWFIADCPKCAAIPEDAALFHEALSDKGRKIVGGRYHLRVSLSKGAVTRVYRAVDPANPSTEYAVKEFSPAAMFRPEERLELDNQFHALCDTWRTVETPGIARIVDVFSERDRYYVVSEYVDGWSLKRIISERRVHATPELARNWGAQLCETLKELYSAHPGLHLPFLAPQHIMVSAAGKVKLVDLGLTALFMPRSFGAYGSIKGYAAPELKTSRPSAQSDQFAIGRVLYALLTDYLLETGGHPPSLQRAIPGISTQLVKTIARAARRDAKQRFADINDLRRELWSAMDGDLAPIAGWTELARLAAPREATIADSQTARAGSSMAELGFEADERFGRHTAPSRKPIAQAPKRAPVTQSRPLSQGQAQLQVSPSRLEYSFDGLEKHRETIKIRNTGTAPARVRCSGTTQWLRVPSKPFTLKPGKTAQLICTVDSTLITPSNAHQQGEIIVSWETAQKRIEVLALVPASPSIEIDTPLLDFGAITGRSAYEQELVIRNTGSTPVAGTLGSRVPWLVVSRSNLQIKPDSSLSVSIQLLPNLLERGRHDIPDALILDSDAGQERIGARVSRRAPELYIERTSLDLGETGPFEPEPGASLMVANSGDALLTGNVRTAIPWLSAFPSEFALGPEEALSIDFEVETETLQGLQSFDDAIIIETNAGSQRIALRVDVLVPRLVVRTDKIDFGTLGFGQTAEQTVTIANTGRAPLDLEIKQLVNWLHPGKESIRLQPKQSEQMAIHLDPSAFESSAELVDVKALLFSSSVGTHTVAASITILRPELVVEPETLDFGYIDLTEPVERELMLSNTGTGRLSWQVLTDKPWVEISDSEGTLKEGETTVLKATAYGMGLEKDSEGDKGTLIINSDGGRAKIPMLVGVASPRLACHSAFLDLGESVNRVPVSASFRLFNYGMGKLTGTIRSEERWLVLDHLSFSAPTGRSVVITANTDMDEFPPDSLYETAIVHIESNGGNMELEAAVNVMLEPDLVVVDKVNLAPNPDTGMLSGRLVLLNQGLESAHVELVPGMPQLVISRTFCDVKPGKRVRIAVQWQGEADWDEHKAIIRIVGDDRTLEIPVTKTD